VFEDFFEPRIGFPKIVIASYFLGWLKDNYSVYYPVASFLGLIPSLRLAIPFPSFFEKTIFSSS
jgi:hypothetical protein